MDTPEEARDYDAMDHSAVNGRFVADFQAVHGPARGGIWLDVGTGPGRIAIALCQADAQAKVLGVDLADSMLAVARRNVAAANLHHRIQCERADAKRLPYPNEAFEAVVSNTIIHHIAQPLPALMEMARLVAPGGTVFVRDLARPENSRDLDRLVRLYAGTESPPAQAMFAASLQAAFTPAEVRERMELLGLPAEGVAMTSDRHWTWCWRRPGSA